MYDLHKAAVDKANETAVVGTDVWTERYLAHIVLAAQEELRVRLEITQQDMANCRAALVRANERIAELTPKPKENSLDVFRDNARAFATSIQKRDVSEVDHFYTARNDRRNK